MPFYSWTVAGPRELNVRCGYDGVAIPEDEPVEEIRRTGLTRVLLRCATHAHTPIDWAQVDQARHARDVRRAEEQHPAEAQPARRAQSSASMSGLFDHKTAAAGRDE